MRVLNVALMSYSLIICDSSARWRLFWSGLRNGSTGRESKRTSTRDHHAGSRTEPRMFKAFKANCKAGANCFLVERLAPTYYLKFDRSQMVKESGLPIHFSTYA